MKICLVANNFHPRTGGGESERSYKLAEQLIKRGDQVYLIAVDDGLPLSRKTVLNLSESAFFELAYVRFRVPRLDLAKVSKLIRGSDKVHFMGYWSILNVVCFIFCLRYSKEFFITTAGALEFFGRSRWLKHLFHFVIGRFMLEKSKAVIAITELEKTRLVSLGIPSNKIWVIPNGVSVDDFTIASNEVTQAITSAAALKLLFIGRLNAIKGIDLLVDAFCRLARVVNDIDLFIVGPDEGVRSNLSETISTFKLEHRVHFLGILTGKEKAQVLSECDLVCIPSRKEAMSIVALEAGVTGKPVLITDECGLPEIETKKLGWICKADAESIYSSLQEIVNERHELKEKGAKFKTYVLENYEWRVVIGAYASLFSQHHSEAKSKLPNHENQV